MKRVLMVAFHFPPLAGSSGIQRTLRFVQHLPALGWEPVVLTVHPRAYERTSEDLTRDVPPGVVVERAFGLDTARHLAVVGRYPGFLACPDRWVTWRIGAIPAGLRLIRDFRPDVVWSTYPIATAHAIGHALQLRTGLPWVADFRDPMAQEGYPADPRVRRSFVRIEQQAARQARACVFTTRGAATLYRERYPAARDRMVVIPNGYDEESFAGLAADGALREPLHRDAFTLLHSGVVYPQERDPTQLFVALRRMIDQGALQRGRFRIRFRAAGHDDLLRELTAHHALSEFVEVLPPVAYREALAEMIRAEGLLVLQAANCNEQVPAKLYEYLRSGRPIMALTDPRGDTAAVMRDAGIDIVAPLDSADEIATCLERFVAAVAANRGPLPRADYVLHASRRERAQSLAALFERVCAPG